MDLTASYLPEGRLLYTPENMRLCADVSGLSEAMKYGTVLEGNALLCSSSHDLTVSLGPFTGVIPRREAALGIAEGSTRDIAILTRVGKPVSFTVQRLEEIDGTVRPILSRRLAQEKMLAHALETWSSGQILPATVTHLEPFGAFVDIGCGVSSMIGIENISVSRISDPKVRFTPGQEIYVLVTALDPSRKRVSVSHKELLGTWEENARDFSVGMTVPGYVRSTKEYGHFIELTPNLSGLAEYQNGIREGDRVSVYIKAILPQRMKIKLLLIDRLPEERETAPLRYFLTGGSIKAWRYAPVGCKKGGEEEVFS